MQSATQWSYGLQAGSDGTKPGPTDHEMLLGADARRLAVPLLLQELAVAAFSWNRSQSCDAAPSEVQTSTPRQLLRLSTVIIMQ